MLLEHIKEYISCPNWAKGIVFGKNREKEIIFNEVIRLTNFLHESSPASQRKWHILNDIFYIPLCGECRLVEVKFHSGHGYSKFCSTKCSANAETSKQSAIETNLKKYGKTHVAKVEQFQDKWKQTNITKYGVPSTLSNKSVKDKIKTTMVERHGTETPFSNDGINQKRKETMFEKYGTVHALQHAECFIKHKTTMIERHGGEHALQIREFKDKANNTNIRKYNRVSSVQQHISEESLNLLNDSSWLKAHHHDNKENLTYIASQLGVDPTTIHNRLAHFGIEIRNYYESNQEKEIKIFLHENYSEDILSGDRKILQGKELDIYIPLKNLAIEFNGLYWHSELHKDNNYHKMKFESCKRLGIRLIQIFEDEWKYKPDIVKKHILYAIGLDKSKRVYARHTNIVEVNIKNKKAFLNNTHIQGNGNSSINYGLEIDGVLVALIGIKKVNNSRYEIDRYSTSCSVVGGFSKLLKHFEKTHNPEEIVTFADLRWSNGDLYEKTGFKLNKIINPDYYWVNDKNKETISKRFHKFNFRHSRMSKILALYDKILSESQNMRNNGYYKIYDAGKLRFVKVRSETGIKI